MSRRSSTTCSGGSVSARTRESGDVGEQDGKDLPPHGTERLILGRQNIDQLGREITREIGASAVGAAFRGLRLAKAPIGLDTPRNVTLDGHVLIDLAAAVLERDDRPFHEEFRSVFAVIDRKRLPSPPCQQGLPQIGKDAPVRMGPL